MNNSILIAFPCYNEEENIATIFSDLKKVALLYQGNLKIIALFIDDNSTDGTIEAIIKEGSTLVSGLNYKLIRHSKNLGLAGGIRSAFREFYKLAGKESGVIACGFMDGDGSHNPGHIVGMISKIICGFDVVICSRYQAGSRTLGVSFYRQILSYCMSLIFQVAGKIPNVRDYSCGFRLYSPELCRKLWEYYGENIVIEKSFACMVELLVRCHKFGAIITEHPMLLRYDLKGGVSKMRIIPTIIGTLRVLLVNQ